jgi:hypothetical protein
MKKLMSAAVLGATFVGMSLMGGAAQAGTVTFDDSVGNSIVDQVVSSFTDQGLTFTSHGTYMGVWNSNPNGNGTNSDIFAGFNTGDYESITLAGGGTFNLNSLDLAISWYDSNPSEIITINGSPLTITQTYTTYLLNLDGVSQVNISGVPSNSGYWLADNLNFTAATPLPSTWTMLIAGFIGLGFFASRGTKKGSAAIAAA